MAGLKSQTEMDFARQEDDHNSSDESQERNLQIDMEKMESLSRIAEMNGQISPKLTVFESALVLVATNIGGGILGLPFAFYHLGIPLSLILCFIMATLGHFSSMMYLKTKDLTPGKYESIYEIAYLLFGRPSLFVVLAILFSSVLGSAILYYIVIGETYSTLTTQLLVMPDDPKSIYQIQSEMDKYPWWLQMTTNRRMGTLLAGGIHLVTIYKRQLKEMKVVSYMLLIIVSIFIVMVCSELFTDGVAVADTIKTEEMMKVKGGVQLITSITIVIFAYSLQQMVFPTYTELEKRSNKRFSQSSLISTSIYSTAFLLTGLVGLLVFGADVKSDFLLNIS